ncbi:STE protein kinase [Apiospora aurea]|uniref:non-specific serine/threonine protein kinase n=1 Tax=Apiospora aurea TaxID=335848 RepID=A0ABR1Q163_9PEZI
MSGTSSKPPPGSVAVRKSGMGRLERLPISSKPLDHLYERVKTIDDGSGNLGGMNAGVYIVREKKTRQIYVQKCYRSNNSALIKLFRDEIGYMRRLMHSSIVQYVDAYVNVKAPYEAAAYMEYCDRGSLRDMVKIYNAEKNKNHNLFIPESFIWHALLGLSDALYFLNTGQSFISVELQKNDPQKWKPIIHRDIKPDRKHPTNDIFLRSRDTPNSPKPPYVLLSDFGIACYEDATTAGSNKAGPYLCAGTPEYHAPELCFNPKPTPLQSQTQQRSPHTALSDIFAIALLVYCLCERSLFPHIDPKCLPLRSAEALGRAARPARLDISARGVYSDYLARVIDWAGVREPSNRPGAQMLVEGVQRQCQLWKADPNWQAQVAETLPDWAAPKRKV